MKKNILLATNSQKALDFLLDHPVRDFMETEILQAIKISKSGTNYALRELENRGFISRNKRGKSHFYTLNHKDPVIKQMKVLKTILEIESLIKKLTPLTSKMILFGSSSRGENTSDSDIDLFIVSHSPDLIHEEIAKFRSRREIQTVIRSNLKFAEMKQTEPVFYEQVIQGILLWEAQDES